MIDDDIVYAEGCFKWLAQLVYALALTAACFVVAMVWAWL